MHFLIREIRHRLIWAAGQKTRPVHQHSFDDVQLAQFDFPEDALKAANVAASPRDLPAGLEANDVVVLLPLRRSEVAAFSAMLERLDNA